MQLSNRLSDPGVDSLVLPPRISVTEAPPETPEAPFLPDEVVRAIARVLVSGSSPAGATISLLSMCGVCQQFRRVASEVSADVCIGFDCLDNTFAQTAQPSITRFRRLSPAQKQDMFLAAAQLLTGYTEVSFSGVSVTDELLQIVASRVSSRLIRIKLSSSCSVTDVGLSALTTEASQLQQLSVEDVPTKASTGTFLVRLFEGSPQLSSLTLHNIPSLNWAPLTAHAWSGGAVSKLSVRGVNLNADFGLVLSRLGQLTDLEMDGPAKNIKAASISCPGMVRLSYQVSNREQLDEALSSLAGNQDLRQLELIIRNFGLTTDQLRVIGMLPVVEMRLDSFTYKQQPTLSRSSYSHVDNEGVKALVDSICNRWCNAGEDMKPLKLSLCGATSLTHDAVSALLRLPILTELDIGGCCKITAMDKMRLVAKVRAGREMLDSGRRPTMRSNRFPGLVM